MDMDYLVSGIDDIIEGLGEQELELAGEEEMVEGEAYVEGDEVGAPRRKRRIRFPTRKAKKAKVKSSQSGDLSRQYQQLRNEWAKFKQEMKQGLATRKYQKGAAVGNRAIFTATNSNIAASASATVSGIVGNASIKYDRVCFISNTPALITQLTAAGNVVLEGSNAIAVDAGRLVGPFQMAESVDLSGNGGVAFTAANRGASAGDVQVVFLPEGFAFGDQFPKF